MTAKQLRMAIAVTRVQLQDLADATRLDKSQLSRIANQKQGASMETLATLRRYFVDNHQLRFEARDGAVYVGAPDDE